MSATGRTGGRDRIEVLAKEAVGVERAWARDLPAIEDAAELSDVLGAAEADVAAGLAGIGCTTSTTTGREKENERANAHEESSSKGRATCGSAVIPEVVQPVSRRMATRQGDRQILPLPVGPDIRVITAAHAIA